MSLAPQPSQALQFLHSRLYNHFQGLKTQRLALEKSAPVFALEHGLSDDELAALEDEVRHSVQRGVLSRAFWLPFVVYAAEVGYDYSGEDYWPTFEGRTPGWAYRGSTARDYIRARFRQFAKDFAGAVPVGSWAENFTIICWPITHAVLPTDLQRQLVRLLFDYRRALAAELLSDPDLLGVKLAARAGECSARFRCFAQNTSLLGQVAAALLVGDDEESPFLLSATSHRIVKKLSAEREARTWLRDAKSSAHKVRTHGFMAPGLRSNGAREPAAERLPAATDPTLFLTRSSDGWTVNAELPDLSPLAERLPELHHQLGRLRARVAGRRRPLATGQLLHAGQHVRLDEWPSPREAFVQLEGAPEAANGLLADQCLIRPGPVWLFRVRGSALAVEVRGRFVRPKRDYILVTAADFDPPAVAWIEPTPIATTGVRAYNVRVPSQVSTEDLAMLRTASISAVTDCDVRPVGLVAGGWDGDGYAEWLTGEVAVIGIRSQRTPSSCEVRVDGVPHEFDWLAGAEEAFVALSGLGNGSHRLVISLVPMGVDLPLVQGSLVVSIRPPRARPDTGTVREGLMILTSPAQPTLPELWDGKASLRVDGPAGMPVTLDIALSAATGHSLGNVRRQVRLPLEPGHWASLARELRAGAMRRGYDDAERCRVTAGNPNLGTATVAADRPFTPLRWVSKRERDVQGARLIDNTGSTATTVERYAFAAPTHAEPLTVTTELITGPPQGALLVASAAHAQASVILPPDPNQLRHLSGRPEVPLGRKTVPGVQALIEANGRWSTASLPADPFAQSQQRIVLRSLTGAICSLIAGQRWQHLETQVESTQDVLPDDLEALVGHEHYQRSIAHEISQLLPKWQQAPAETRGRDLTDILHRLGRPAVADESSPRLGEFLLRLTSAPSSLLLWDDGERTRLIGLALVSPVLVRAARYAVLAVDSSAADPSYAAFGGWSWT